MVQRGGLRRPVSVRASAHAPRANLGAGKCSGVIVLVAFGYRVFVFALQYVMHVEPVPFSDPARLAPSYTHRPTFGRFSARSGSWSNFCVPQNSFVWENEKTCSRPYKVCAHFAPLEKITDYTVQIIGWDSKCADRFFIALPVPEISGSGSWGVG